MKKQISDLIKSLDSRTMELIEITPKSKNINREIFLLDRAITELSGLKDFYKKKEPKTKSHV